MGKILKFEKDYYLLQGIYRVSGVKSKVEGLCQRFEKNPDSIDLSEEHPNGIANVLKLYLREVSKAISMLFTPASGVKCQKLTK
jgi:hypothetical protein